MTGSNLIDFVKESNRIEGIIRRPTSKEIKAHVDFLSLKTLDVADMEEFVNSVASADLRRHAGMNVRVGKHYPMKGSAEVEWALRELLVHQDSHTPFSLHVAYELLHPFMDGNGRSGRVLWLWKMGGIGKAPLGFLHHFYYQTLESKQ
jgi:hypothetical protein